MNNSLVACRPLSLSLLHSLLLELQSNPLHPGLWKKHPSDG